jgi:hypothetical protein
MARDRRWSPLSCASIAKPRSRTERDHEADVERASELLAELFPNGVDFVKLPYPKQWAEADKRIALVRERGSRKDIERLAGAAFWSQIERLHKQYGEVLGITKNKEAAQPAVNLMEPLRATQRAVANYILQVAASAAHDDAFVNDAMRALAPVDAARDAAAKRSTGSAPLPPVTPDTPLPPAPAA